MSPQPPPAADDSPAEDSSVRLQKFLASAGYGSRRKCEEFITDGRVTIDGVPATDLGVKVDPRSQQVAVDGEKIRVEPKRYYVLNKPPGYVCTHSDPGGRPRAVDLLPGNLRLFTVGRLDENSRGLLLVTNDGELANRLAHPRYGVPRRYQVLVAGKPTREVLDQLRAGLWFTEGKFFVDDVRPIRARGNATILEVELKQGRNREIRRLFARVGHKVMSLERVTFGPLKLGGLGMGKARPLKKVELDALRELVRRQKSKTPAGTAKASGRKPSSGRSGTRNTAAGKPDRKRRSSR